MRDRRPHFVIFVVWEALIAGGCVVVAWSQKSYLRPAEISSFLVLVKFKNKGRRLSLRLNLYISDVDPGNEDIMCKRVGAKIFLCDPHPASPILELNQVHKK